MKSDVNITSPNSLGRMTPLHPCNRKTTVSTLTSLAEIMSSYPILVSDSSPGIVVRANQLATAFLVHVETPPRWIRSKSPLLQSCFLSSDCFVLAPHLRRPDNESDQHPDHLDQLIDRVGPLIDLFVCPAGNPEQWIAAGSAERGTITHTRGVLAEAQYQLKRPLEKSHWEAIGGYSAWLVVRGKEERLEQAPFFPEPAYYSNWGISYRGIILTRYEGDVLYGLMGDSGRVLLIYQRPYRQAVYLHPLVSSGELSDVFLTFWAEQVGEVEAYLHETIDRSMAIQILSDFTRMGVLENHLRHE